MRLLKVKISGVRRFETTDALLVADRLVAIVGPNEAGKTSLLKALDQIDRVGQPLPASMATRQCSTSPRVEALFGLDEDDLEALAGIHDTKRLRRFWLVRTTTGSKWRLEGRPMRDLNPRITALAALTAVRDDPIVAEQGDLSDLGEWDRAWSALSSEEDTLEAAQLGAVVRLAKEMQVLCEAEAADDEGVEDDETPETAEEAARRATLENAIEALNEASTAEALPSPFSDAVQVLKGRLPAIVTFSDADRDLLSEYDLTEITTTPPPRALSNIAELAGLVLEDLHTAIEAGDHGSVRLLRENANKKLFEVFGESYSQSDVCLQLDTDGFLIRLLVRAEGGEDFVELSERSAGFKWFVALVAFLAQNEHRRPLVLIDEIETHLHYDAQADVVDVLARQSVAEQIVYTTHSAGALPPDLGRGVRAVVPVKGRQRSKISNSFWTSGPGFAPLIFGMGAATLPFSVPRFVLIAEGASDAVLVPTLLREATGQDELLFRIAPGLAETSLENLSRLEQEGGLVAYLVDGDNDGAAYSASLRGVGVPASSILDLSCGNDSFSTPEDLLSLEAYCEAVNREGEPFWNGERIETSLLQVPGRAKAVEDWCKKRGFDPPSKVRVAQNLVEMSRADLVDKGEWPSPGASLCSSEGVACLRELHKKVLLALGLAGESGG